MAETVTLDPEQLDTLAEKVAAKLRKPMKGIEPEPEDLSDHIDEQLREAFRPKGPRAMVKLSVRYQSYMIGEVVQFSEEEARVILRNGWGTEASELDVTQAQRGRIMPMHGVRFFGRYKQFMPGDVAALPVEEAARVVKMTFRDEKREVQDLATYVALNDDARPPAESVIAREQAQGMGGKFPQGDASNDGGTGI